MTSTPVTKNLELSSTGSDEDETCRTFIFRNEDHTLGNALRYIIMRNPDVQFCGYSVPHPSENKINCRIQTFGVPATEVLKKGLKDLNKVCSHVLQTFESSMRDYRSRNSPGAAMDTTDQG
ncbi:hypothetical protein ACJMK2_031361 [Sinanodonta woodiana]|uniref:DNA-directed RNA polymerases I and III subunit RPAC2 n=1 Tax=Sinanodonta woodiana TaxID=1069815 RepID=A0ABD3WYJ5_SINWO